MPVRNSRKQIIGNKNSAAMTSGQEDTSVDAQAIEFQCDTNEKKILDATIKALNSGSLTPLIKEELRCTIQSRRLAEGKGELKVEFKSPPKKKTMTEEERARYLKRRVQNREAAQRFRQKQKDTSDMLSAKIQKLERKSRSLLVDLNRLREEKDSLREMLKSHLLVCTNQHHIPTILSPNQLDQLLSEGNHVHTHTSDSSVCGSSISMSDTLSPTGSVSTSYFSATPPPRPGTADSSAGGSDVFFFPDEADAEGLSFVDANQNTEVEVFVTSGAGQIMDANNQVEGQPLQTFEFSPNHDISFIEEVVIDTNGGPDFAQPQRPDSTEAMRLDSCSSVDTAVDGRGLGNSTGSFSSSNFQPLFYDNSVCPDASAVILDNSISIPGFNHDINMYIDDEGKGQQIKVTQELAETLVNELSRSRNSDFDLSAMNVSHGGVIANVNGESEAAAGLVESTSDLRHSLAFAYSRVHDMCDVDLGYPIQDFLLKSDAVP